jgi:hypothetical protein
MPSPIEYKNLRILIDKKDHEGARGFLHRYEQNHPNDKEITFLLAEVYNRLDNWHEAERYYKKTILLDPNYILAYTNLEQILRVQGRYKECRSLLEEVRRLSPKLSKVIDSSIGMLDLSDGRLDVGFKKYENRFEFNHMKVAYEKELFPRWKGKGSLKNKRILLRYEQGLGDTLQFSRYAKTLKNLGARKIDILCKKPLHRILETIPGVSKAIENPLETYDFEVMMMSMPSILNTTQDSDIPGKPYLKVKDEDSKRWLEIMKPNGKLRVGIVWSGELKKGLNSWEAERMNQHRSIPLEKWRPILDVECEFYSLQKGEMQKSLENFYAAHPIKDCMNGVKDFYDTACIVDNLDLVISVDTSMAHLVGALGKPIWMLSRLDADWRWMSPRTDTPWYPSMKIYCQEVFVNWSPVIEKVSQDLRKELQ